MADTYIKPKIIYILGTRHSGLLPLNYMFK